jgi:predicted  nucleic acid-binding Zn-ribbon protein
MSHGICRICGSLLEPIAGSCPVCGFDYSPDFDERMSDKGNSAESTSEIFIQEDMDPDLDDDYLSN